MANYEAPSKEIGFVMQRVLDYQRLNGLPAFSEATSELTEAILEAAAKFAGEVLAPLNRVGDIEGVTLDGTEVRTPEGFATAYQKFVSNEWLGLAQDQDYGGQGLPFLVHLAAAEMWNSACTSFALCPMLTAGAIDALSEHANNELKQQYLPNLVTGKWSATMNLTEPHAGSDLSKLKTRAEPHGENYLIKGQKIYITWGEHDMAENIIHIVLAPMIDAPSGNKGLSLFLVPKYLVKEDGSLGERNDLKVISTEHKLGINASPTCVMSFGENKGAVGYLIGNPGDGLACMFTLMNHARLEVGLQGVALSERAYQDALAYARERVQGRNAETGESARIIQHADVQRMLMQMKSITDAMRGLTYDAAFAHDFRVNSETEQQRQYYEDRFALLTPVVKAWCTELVNEVTSIGIQVHGGMGFIEETGAAQHYRDARIAAIYEGTNGIQANDLVGRKILRDQGAAIRVYIEEIIESASVIEKNTELKDIARKLEEAARNLDAASKFIVENSKLGQGFVGVVAFNFLMMMGYVCGAWYMARSAEKAISMGLEGDPGFSERKLASVNFYFGQMLPRHKSYMDAVIDGAGAGMALKESSF
ncbi:MAG: acyl-CoA dehydrogenase [Gammaproteobacteria bacterium]|nr:acyl-CoA dehydrogenase [Gammaproteobacteria bacterium]